MALFLNLSKINVLNASRRGLASIYQQSYRHKSDTPLNLGILFVPQQVKILIKKLKYSQHNEIVKSATIVLILGSMDSRKNGKVFTHPQSWFELFNTNY